MEQKSQQRVAWTDHVTGIRREGECIDNERHIEYQGLVISSSETMHTVLVTDGPTIGQVHVVPIAKCRP